MIEYVCPKCGERKFTNPDNHKDKGIYCVNCKFDMRSLFDAQVDTTDLDQNLKGKRRSVEVSK